mmetsp:Transcript_15480/g.37129  ORF Transcript_15480/g.37129 Transcript_15480/m.37129 type:complete len:588 (+) Transcript_15480:325-2088(+)
MSTAVRRTVASGSLSSSSSSDADVDELLDSKSIVGKNNNGVRRQQQHQSLQCIKPPQSSLTNSNKQNTPSPSSSATSINNPINNKPRSLLSARRRSVLLMSLSLAVHLSGYELSRAAVMALFTSDGLGFGHGDDGGLSALPMAVGCVSPFSMALLWFYAGTLRAGGPSYALRTHALICAGVQIVSGWALGAFDSYLGMDATRASLANWPESRVRAFSMPLLFFLFVFQSAYVQLLYNQHWAFIGSVLTPEEGKRAFAPIAGLGSIGSTLTAGLVSVFINRFGLIGLLHLAGASYIVSAILADMAFGVAMMGGFEPRGGANKYEGTTCSEDSKRNDITKPGATSAKGAYTALNGSNDSASSSSSPIINCIPSCGKKRNIFQQATALFQRVPVLGALFLEVIVSQCLSSLVNFIYLSKLKSTVIDDAMRAGWAGKFYAWVNGVSGVFQFFVIPILLKHVDAHRIWLFMPTLMLCCTVCTFATFGSSGLFGASASFFTIKTMEYSLRGAANEMLYVSLDYESRYLGKKAISLIAGKFGKSAMAVALSLVMVVYGDTHDTMWYLLATATVFTFLWLFSSIRLHSLIETSKS